MGSSAFRRVRRFGHQTVRCVSGNRNLLRRLCLVVFRGRLSRVPDIKTVLLLSRLACVKVDKLPLLLQV